MENNFEQIIEDSHTDSFRCKQCQEVLRFTYTAKPEIVEQEISTHVCKKEQAASIE